MMIPTLVGAMIETDTAPTLTLHWFYQSTLLRLGLAVGGGVFVGLEREHHGKTGVRTFAFAGLLGCLGGLGGPGFAVLSLGMVAALVFFMNWRQMARDKSLALTTSAALLLVGYAGVLCGQGHTFTPVAATAITAALLAWKQPLAGFATGLSQTELRSAILLVLLSFVIYPTLPDTPVDPWGLIEPRSAWATVVLIAALGFVNYILWKLYGSRGVEITGFLGGLVNSTAAVAELARTVRESDGRLLGTTYRGVLLATAAMLLRNAVVLGVLNVDALRACAPTLALMFIASFGFAWWRFGSPAPPAGGEEKWASSLRLESPFSLPSALRFGFAFLVLQVAGTLGRRYLGTLGFYAVSVAGGLFSSASAAASAGTLAAHGLLNPLTAANGTVLAVLTSAIINFSLIARAGNQGGLTRALGRALVIVAVVGVVGVAVRNFLLIP